MLLCLASLPVPAGSHVGTANLLDEAPASACSVTEWNMQSQAIQWQRCCVWYPTMLLSPPCRVPLQVAGAYGMTILYGVAPPLMALRLRQSTQPVGDLSSIQQQNSLLNSVHDLLEQVKQPQLEQRPPQLRTAALLPAGRPVLIALCCMATGVTASRLWVDLGEPSGYGLLAQAAAAAAGLPAAIMSAIH